MVTGPLWLGATNLAGDGQADLVNHGGADKAALAYGAARYDHWRADLPALDWAYGGFGENFTIAGDAGADGVDEEHVCIGDVYRIGEGEQAARVQVSQPRQPCWKLARRWEQTDLTARVHTTGYTGWYLRVLQEGEVAAGMPVTLLERRHPAWTVMRATQVMQDKGDVAGARALGMLPELATGWRDHLLRRAKV
ncbi:MOSC domain-containing protein [bacterium]|nr:MOSC domain-containing protein [bacterium]